MSGIEVAWSKGETVRFLSLTSSKESKNDIHRSFEAFVKRVRREFGRFEYLAVRENTLSGLSHIHILFRGCYMPFGWIKENWYEIHKASNVYVEKVYGRKAQVANYLVKYFGKSLGSYRFWCSSAWVFKGFVRFWADLSKRYGCHPVKACMLRVCPLCPSYGLRIRVLWLWKRFLRGEIPLFDRYVDLILRQKTLIYMR